MDAIKIFLLVLFFCPILTFGQKKENKKFPKDTIYIKFKKHNDHANKWHGKHKRFYENNEGLLFNLKTTNGNIILFYNFNHKADTLCISELINYKTLNLKEIRNKEIEWIDRKFTKSKYKPYTGTRNAIFNTYLIEIISDSCFVIYPVIWRNQGVAQ